MFRVLVREREASDLIFVVLARRCTSDEYSSSGVDRFVLPLFDRGRMLQSILFGFIKIKFKFRIK